MNHWDIRPGMLVMLKRGVGGYDKDLGWTGDPSNKLSEAPRAGRGATLRDDPRTEVGYGSRLEDHLEDVKREAGKLCDALSLNGGLREAVVKAAGLHDLGKAHPQWQGALPDRSGIPDALLAKSPRVVAVDVAGDGCDAHVRREFARLRPKAHALPDEARRRGREDVVRLRWAIDDKLSDGGVIEAVDPGVCGGGDIEGFRR